MTREMLNGLPTPRRYLTILALSFGTALVVIDGAIPTVGLVRIGNRREVYRR